VQTTVRDEPFRFKGPELFIELTEGFGVVDMCVDVMSKMIDLIDQSTRKCDGRLAGFDLIKVDSGHVAAVLAA
tara:strand:+ start:877 stop:1095 length:219 start_codon:yes stop_codon:yes gene_type:complete